MIVAFLPYTESNSELRSLFQQQESDNQIRYNSQLNDYYETLRHNLIEALDGVKLPGFTEENTKPNSDNFDNYLRKLNELCVESYKDENKTVFSNVRSALQDFGIPGQPAYVR